MITSPTSIDKNTTKVKRLRKDRFCPFVVVLFRFCFVAGFLKKKFSSS
jgi:hypothetical protein